MEYKLQKQLCVEIYNYLETRPSGETGIMFAMLDQSMKSQEIEMQKKEAEDKMRFEINEEAKKSIEEAAKNVKPKKVKNVLPE